RLPGIAHLLLGPALDGMRGVDDLGVVDEDVDRAPMLDDGRDRLVALLDHPDVALERKGVASQRLDLLGDQHTSLVAPREDRDLGALLGQGQGLTPPDAFAGTGHDRNLALQQTTHDQILARTTSASSSVGARSAGGSPTCGNNSRNAPRVMRSRADS